MAHASRVHHDTIVVPVRMSAAEVQALAQRKAIAQAGEDATVAFVHLHGSRPLGAEEVEWRYSYQVIPPGDETTSTPD
jgi:hypothetical protein